MTFGCRTGSSIKCSAWLPEITVPVGLRADPCPLFNLCNTSLPQKAAYAMTKGALDILTLELAKQLGPRGITVNSLAPGFTETDMSADLLNKPEVRQFAVSASALGRIGGSRMTLRAPPHFSLPTTAAG